MRSITITVIVLISPSIISTSGQQCPEQCRCQLNKEGFEVNCRNTGRMVIPKGIPETTVTLDLSQNELQGIHIGDLRDLDNLSFLNLSQNGFWGDAIEQGALELPNLNSIDLSGNQYKTIPSHLPSKLESLYFGSNPIESIGMPSFRNYTSLVELDLSNTRLIKIYPHTFDKLPNIATISFSYSPLSNLAIPDDLFAYNMKLTSLSLRSTNITSPLPNLPNSLNLIDYVGNDIKVLHSYTFKTLHNLQFIQLSNNPITTIEDNAFEGLNDVMILDVMESNVSSVIGNNTLSGLQSLQSLYLNDNLIPNIETDALHDLQNLESLWLSGNKLRTIAEGVLDPKNVPHLFRLSVDSNPWFCDCHLKWLREKANNASYTVMYLNAIKCDGPPNVAGKTWDALKPEDFVC